MCVDSRYLGNEIRLRRLRDASNNTVIIGDPLQTALSDGIIDAWRIYSTAVSLYHAVYLQVIPKLHYFDLLCMTTSRATSCRNILICQDAVDWM